MPQRITNQNYAECELETRIVIDYLAANKVVPRVVDDGETTPSMEGRSSSDIAEEIRKEFSIYVADGMPTWVYQRCGDHEYAPAFFTRHRQRLIIEHLSEKWDNLEMKT
jgi:hypothetical protein